MGTRNGGGTADARHTHPAAEALRPRRRPDPTSLGKNGPAEERQRARAPGQAEAGRTAPGVHAGGRRRPGRGVATGRGGGRRRVGEFETWAPSRTPPLLSAVTRACRSLPLLSLTFRHPPSSWRVSPSPRPGPGHRHNPGQGRGPGPRGQPCRHRQPRGAGPSPLRTREPAPAADPVSPTPPTQHPPKTPTPSHRTSGARGGGTTGEWMGRRGARDRLP